MTQMDKTMTQMAPLETEAICVISCHELLTAQTTSASSVDRW